MRAACAAVFLALGVTGPAGAVTCDTVEFDGTRYTLCEVKPERDALKLFLRDDAGAPWGQFYLLEEALRDRGRRLVFAMNAGMYHDDRSPVGLYIEDGIEEMRPIASPGPGNFGLLPNGVLCIGKDSAQVIETRTYLETQPVCRHATQSGPMLVIDGALHPRFLPDSTSRYIRNGVGTSEDGKTAYFALSETSVTFHEFARLFRDGLGLDNALFLDGNVSRLHAPALGRSDPGRRMGPIVGVTEPVAD